MSQGWRRIHARVSGRVQGVGFRASAADQARRLDLAGWVRNLADGRVELEAEGSEEDVERLLAYLQHGPRTAHVTSVDIEWQASGTGGGEAGSEVGLSRSHSGLPPLSRPFEILRDAP